MEIDGGNLEPQPGTGFAPQACQNCRKQKRKCDKALPLCGLCQRIGRPCDYSVQESQSVAPTSDEFAALRQKVAELEGLLTRSSPNGHTNNSNGSSNGGNGWANGNSSSPNSMLTFSSQTSPPIFSTGISSFPGLFFLDSDIFEYGRFQVQAPYLKVPPGALGALGNSTELRQMIELYFDTVHSYFPMVSKIRLYQHLSNPMHEPGADMALLFLSMRLITSEVPEGSSSSSQTQLYQNVKSFLASIEAQNGFSMQLIQSVLLVALYELGHAIYPAAYFTVGHAARLGHALGIHDKTAPQMLPRTHTWTEQEERRRVWWSVVVLDRFIMIGNRRKPFATNDPSLEAHLPIDDSSWDRGQMVVAAPLALSASQTIQAAPFARVCQSAHLLGKAIRHINDKNLPMDYKYNEALQLHRTLRALCGVLPEEASHDDPANRPSLCSPMAICYSALLILYDNYSCSERQVETGPEEQLMMQKESIDGLSEISNEVMGLSRRMREIVDRDGLHRLSPLVIDALYQAAANFAWYVRESSDPECAERLRELKELLIILDRRWKVAGEYLRILEAADFELASAISEQNVDPGLRPLCEA